MTGTKKSQAWPIKPLRDVCEMVQYGFTASAQEKEVGPRFLRITDIVPPAIDWSSVPYCEIDTDLEGKYRIRSGDIVIARTGATTGYAKFIRRTPRAVFASYLVRLRVREGIHPAYVGAVVESDDYKKFIMRNVGGAAQPNANAQVLTSFPIAVPPLETQRKISSILTAYDDLIESNLRRIQILEEMARLVYREWFVHFRFPGHEKVHMVDSALGKIPDGWELKRLGEIAENFDRLRKPLSKMERAQMHGDYPYYGAAKVFDHVNEGMSH